MHDVPFLDNEAGEDTGVSVTGISVKSISLTEQIGLIYFG